MSRGLAVAVSSLARLSVSTLMCCPVGPESTSIIRRATASTEVTGFSYITTPNTPPVLQITHKPPQAMLTENEREFDNLVAEKKLNSTPEEFCIRFCNG